MSSTPVKVKFLGCGDAFGSGGRMQACIMVRHAAGCFLMDCGATALVSMRRYGIEPNSIAAILISHLHGDHFGGLPYFIIEAQHVSKRSEPLYIGGPAGTAARLEAAMKTLFPGSAAVKRQFAVEITELEPGTPGTVGDLTVHSYTVEHPSGAPSLALRMQLGEKIIAYSGDTAWTDSLLEASRGADLLVAEAYTFDRELKNHLSHAVLLQQQNNLQAGRIILTHMGPETLARLPDVQFETAQDGAEFTL